MIRKLFLAALIVFLLPLASAHAGVTIALLPPSGDNVSPQILQASRELFKDHLLRTGLAQKRAKGNRYGKVSGARGNVHAHDATQLRRVFVSI